MMFRCAGKSFSGWRKMVVSASCVAASLCGCYSTALSRAYVESGTGWSSEIAGRAQRITWQDINIYVKASNRISKIDDETKRKMFGVSLFFELRTDDIEFIPMEVSLRLPGAPVIKPVRFKLQVTGNNSGLDIWNCGNYNYPFVDFGSGPRYKLRTGFCADFYFDETPPSPDTEFVLQIPELIQNGSRIKVPELRFKKDSVRIVDLPIR